MDGPHAEHSLAANVSAAIRNRRSVKPRLFNGQKVPNTIVQTILEDACWAPTHKLTQPWRFQVFTGAGMERLADFRQAWYRTTVAPHKFDPKKFDRLRSNLLLSSHAIMLCMKRDNTGEIPEVEEIEAVACAAQNLMLSAHAQGVLSFWGSGAETYTPELHEFLGLGADERCLGTIYLGLSDRPPRSARRKPLSTVVRWVDT